MIEVGMGCQTANETSPSTTEAQEQPSLRVHSEHRYVSIMYVYYCRTKGKSCVPDGDDDRAAYCSFS